MEKSFCFGMALGIIAGALITANSRKVRKFVSDSQQQVKDSVEKMSEEKEKQLNESEE